MLFPQTTARQIGRKFDVATAARQMAAFAYAETRLMEAQAGWVLTIPYPEIKIELSYHLYEDAVHADLFRQRMPELGNFSPNLCPPSEHIERFFNEFSNTTDLVERLVGLVRVVRPHLALAYHQYIDGADPVSDAPSVRALNIALQHHQRAIHWGNQLLSNLVENDDDHERAQRWFNHLTDLVSAVGGITSEYPASMESRFRDPSPGRRFVSDPPARDSRFRVESYERREGRAATDVWDQTSFLKYMFMMVEGELEATESCGRTLCDFPDAPWALRLALARQMWDEARHAELSIQRFIELGGDFSLLPVRNHFPLYFGPTQNQDLAKRLAHLNQVIEGWVTDDFSMILDICHQLGDQRSAALFDQLLADEWLHMKIGGDWIPLLTEGDPAYRAEILRYRLEVERDLYASLDTTAGDSQKLRRETLATVQSKKDPL